MKVTVIPGVGNVADRVRCGFPLLNLANSLRTSTLLPVYKVIAKAENDNCNMLCDVTNESN